MLISYNWLKSYIPEIPNEDEITNLITFHLCEIESVEKREDGDSIFDLKILPDRAHDLLSHQGVAREIASLLGLEFKLPEYKIPNSKNTNLQIEIQTENCRRYIGRIVRNIKIGPSPEWVVKYLGSVGQRSINNIVDATNIVLFDCGQPIHAFDLAKLASEKIVVKNAKDGEELSLVGSEKLKANLKNSDMVITDDVKNLAIAGVKGGLDSGINDNTKDILIEVASFDAVSVRKTARRLGVFTDASKRFENDLSQGLCDFAMKEISALVLEMCPESSFEEVVDIYNTKPEERKVSFSTEYVSKILGIKISDEEIEKILKNYNYEFSPTPGSGDMREVVVPPMRLDIEGGHDMVEEIGRAYGYSKIIPVLPEIDFERKDNDIWTKICFIKQKLTDDGYSEVMNYAFGDKGEVEVLASASDKKFLRSNLADGLKESIKLNILNLPLLDIDEVKVFEIGSVFKKSGEEIHVCYGDKKEVKEMDLEKFFSEKISPEEHGYFSAEKFLVLGSSASQVSSEKTSQKKTSLAAHLKKNSSSEFSQEFSKNSFKLWSIYPFITRDIAVWVPERVGPEELINIYKDFGTELLIKEPKLFDSFTKDGRTSFAYRLVFQSDDRTLTNEEVDIIMKNITEKVASFGWEVR